MDKKNVEIAKTLGLAAVMLVCIGALVRWAFTSVIGFIVVAILALLLWAASGHDNTVSCFNPKYMTSHMCTG